MEKIENGNLPEKRFSAGALVATIWDNKGTSQAGEQTSYKTVSLQRRYKDKSGEWQSTTSMRLNDLPRASVVLSKAYEYLVLKDSAGASA